MNEFVLHAVPAAAAAATICLLLHLANNAYLGSRGCRRRRLRKVYSAAIHFGVPNFYSVPNRGAEYCDERVCLCVCVFVCPRSVCSELHVRSSPNFLRILPVVVARSSSGGVVIRCVGLLPVLWMTSYLLKSRGCSMSPPS